MKVIGFDPGLDGALVMYDGREVVAVPVPAFKGTGRGRMINEDMLWNRLSLYGFGLADCAFIEKVGPQPNEARTAAFKFGETAAAPRGMLVALEVPRRFVTPGVWKKFVGLVGGPKEASLGRACELMPQIADEVTPRRLVRTKAECLGVADAALIAYYGYYKLSGE